ncbi:hypothetical protein AVEN_109529-1, partial [Araneus ventricosus]
PLLHVPEEVIVTWCLTQKDGRQSGEIRAVEPVLKARGRRRCSSLGDQVARRCGWYSPTCG